MCMVKGRQDALVFDDPVPNIGVRTCTRSTLLFKKKVGKGRLLRGKNNE